LARIPDEAIRRRKELTHGAWNLYVEYCRQRNHETGRCNPHLSTLAQQLDRTYRYVSECKTELVRKGWVERRGKNGVDLLVGFPPPKVREVGLNPKYLRRPGAGEKSELKFGNFPNLSSEKIRTQVREESELKFGRNPNLEPGVLISEPGIEPVAEAAADSAAGSPPAPDRGALLCTEVYVAEVRASGRYPPDFVNFVWRKLREQCERQTKRLGYPVQPSVNQFEWWLEHELNPPQQELITGARGVGDVRLGVNTRCDSSCPRCFGTGMWYPGGFGKGVARCPGPPGGGEPGEGLKVVSGG
jgi:hypothetical protein